MSSYINEKSHEIQQPTEVEEHHCIHQWTSFYVFADVEKTSTEEPEWKFLGRLFLTCFCTSDIDVQWTSVQG